MHIARAAVLLLTLVSATPAHAAAQRTFVASYGAAANTAFNCSIAKPCRAFSDAIGVTGANGEVVVLDSAGYGPVTIGQSVSIVAPAGVYAGVSVFSGDGVTVNAPGGVVVLRGLTINGQGGDAGISVLAAQEVHVESTIVANMQLSGIFINASADVLIKDSIFRDNGGSGIGIYAGGVTVDNVRSERNGGHGLYIQGGFATVNASSVNRNLNTGMRVESGTHLTVHGTTISGNGLDGVFNNTSQLTLEDCSIDQNGGHGVVTRGGSVFVGAVTTISRSQVNYNGRTSVASGIYSSDDFTGVVVTGSTLHYNNFYDVDATFCCVTTFQNNSAILNKGTNILPVGAF